MTVLRFGKSQAEQSKIYLGIDMADYGELQLVGLPEGTNVMWNNLCINSDDHIHDQDITWIKLSTGVCIDAGQYGTPSFFKVVVVAGGDNWDEVEEIICRTTQEVAAEVVRLAHKYTDPWYAAVARRHETKREPDPSSEEVEALAPGETPFDALVRRVTREVYAETLIRTGAPNKFLNIRSYGLEVAVEYVAKEAVFAVSTFKDPKSLDGLYAPPDDIFDDYKSVLAHIKQLLNKQRLKKSLLHADFEEIKDRLQNDEIVD